MQFAVNVPNFGRDTDPATLQTWVRELETIGVQMAMVSDHVALTPDVQRLFPAPFYDAFTVLAWWAASTSTIRLGTTAIVLPYRHPLHTAKVAASLDRLSGGRLTLGLVPGWAPGEFEALGVPYERRGRLTDEYLCALQALWTRDVASFDGEFVRFHDVRTGPRPVQRPHPPVWIGGNGRRGIERAVRHGAAWHPTSVPMWWLRDVGVPALHATADAASAPPPPWHPRIKVRLTSSRLDDDRRLAGEGTADQLRADLEALERLGAGYVVLDPTYPGVDGGRGGLDDQRRQLAVVAERVVDFDRCALR